MKLTKRIENLPDDIKNYIYHAFLKHEIHYREFRQLLQTHKSIGLDTSDIRHLIPYILSQPVVVQLLRKNIPEFDTVYRTYKIKGEKYFDGFALALLFYMYP